MDDYKKMVKDLLGLYDRVIVGEMLNVDPRSIDNYAKTGKPGKAAKPLLSESFRKYVINKEKYISPNSRDANAEAVLKTQNESLKRENDLLRQLLESNLDRMMKVLQLNQGILEEIRSGGPNPKPSPAKGKPKDN